ncbi:MAG: FG-GAP-like repeat-containing protein [Candidatus Glassbacteria bacterium]
MSKFHFALSLSLATAALLSTPTYQAAQAPANPQSKPAITPASNQLIYRMEFQEPRLERVQVFGETFTKLYMQKTMSIGERIGEPVVQIVPLRLLLPQGTQVSSIEIVTDRMAEVDATAKGFDLAGTEPIIPTQPEVPFGYAPPEELAFDEAAYSSHRAFPDRLYRSLGVGYSHGYAILTLNVYPTKYIPAEGRLIYFPEMTVLVNLDHTGNVNRFYRHNNLDDRRWVESLVANAEVIETYDSPLGEGYPGGLCDPEDNGGLGYDYVIICRQQLLDFEAAYNWDDLIGQKQAQGLEATKVSVEDINDCTDYHNPNPLFDDTPARVREFLRDAYLDWGLQYVLIAGDQDGPAMVQRRLLDYYYESNCESDLYWSNLDSTFNDDEDDDWGEEGDSGFDLYSELWIGSIPCDTGDDVSNWLTKAFYYQDDYTVDYLDNAAFYGGDTGWDCQGDDFIDYSAIYGYDYWPGPIPEPYPDWLWFQYGFDTWNQEMGGLEYDLSVRWTAEPPNPGWQGGSESAAITGLRNAINNDQCTLISGVAHAYCYMSLDVYSDDWESLYHNTKPFFLSDYGCHCGDMDAADDGVLHSMLFHSDTELAFATVYHTGYGWGNFSSTKSSSALQQKSFWDYLFNPELSGSPLYWQMGRAQAWSKDLMAPTIDWGEYGSWRGCIETCLLFGDPAQVIKTPAADRLVGTILNSSDLNPIAGAEIQVIETENVGYSDSAGYYSIWSDYPDTITVVVSKFGFVSDTSLVEVVQEGTTLHDVQLDPIAPGTLNGTVTDFETGDPISASVSLLYFGTPVVQTNTDPFTGFYEFIIPEGTYDVRVVPDLPYLPTSETDVEVLEGEVTTIDFSILPVTTFTEISEEAGIDDQGFGQGTAWTDFDGDGLVDLYVCNLSGSNVLYRNLGGGIFEDVTETSGTGDASSSFGCVWADYDADGDQDLYVTNRNAANRLYQNDGSGTFTDMAASAGVAGDTDYSQAAAWADYDLDGNIDLFVANRFAKDFLFRNNGDGTFSRADSAAGMSSTGPSMAAAWADYDDDGDADLFVSSNFGPNILYENQGDGSFIDVAPFLGLDDDGPATGVAWGDFDLDQDLDLFVANNASSDLLYVNEGGSFAEAASTAGLDYAGTSKSPVWTDLDKDGDLDLLLTTGTRVRYYVNDGTGLFTEIPTASGLDDSSLGEGAATADIDGDGDVDYFLSRSQFAANRLYANNGNLYHYFGIKLTGRLSNRDAIGARITVTVDGISMVREVSGGSGLFSMDDNTQYFGLAQETAVDQVSIEWPSGRTQTLSDLAADQILEVTERGNVFHKVAYPQ